MVIENLTVQPQEKVLAPEPKALDIVFRGSFEEVNDHFYEQEWSAGLPIVPPTMAKIQAFLRYTDRKPEETIGILLPENRAATGWRKAVNSAMDGQVGAQAWREKEVQR